MNLIESVLMKCLMGAEKSITNQLHQLNLRHLKLLCNLECIKRDSSTRIDLNCQLSESLHDLKKEKETQSKTINDLYNELQSLNFIKTSAEKECDELKGCLRNREKEVEDLNNQIVSNLNDVMEL